MSNSPISREEAREAVRALDAADGNKSAAGRDLGITRHAIARRLRAAAEFGITAHGELDAVREIDGQAPGVVRRYLLTAAQNNTALHEGLWRNLVALAAHYDATLGVARIRYNHTIEHKAQEKDTGHAQGPVWYEGEIRPFLMDDRVRLAPGLVWAGDMNELPTAQNPLSGMDSFSGTDSVIFPHMKLLLRSVATSPGDPAKILYTTGAVTLAHYISRKAGFRAEFHHAYAALLVEIDADGDWFVRQINAHRDGAIRDLDLLVQDGVVSRGHRIAVLTPGDLHASMIDPRALSALWGSGGLVDALRPRDQVFHDVFNMDHGHHCTPEDRLRLIVRGATVEGEVARTAEVLAKVHRPFARSWIVRSNHHDHLDRWLRETDHRRDLRNARYYLELSAEAYRAIEDGREVDLLEWALRRAGLPEGFRFLGRMQSLEIEGIEHALHGDIGPSGARGSAENLSRIGRKVNVGHSHQATIAYGAYQAGTCSRLDPDYVRGPSAWSHSHILTHDGGKRQIITQRGGKWKA